MKSTEFLNLQVTTAAPDHGCHPAVAHEPLRYLKYKLANGGHGALNVGTMGGVYDVAVSLRYFSCKEPYFLDVSDLKDKMNHKNGAMYHI